MFKPGVSIRKLSPQMVMAHAEVRGTFGLYGYDCIVTSGDDGKHKEGSLHYEGRALDYRTKHVPLIGHRIAIFNDLTARLSPAGFEVFWENRGEDNEHLHVEYDPK